jgi:DNA-damage-inducible protein D
MILSISRRSGDIGVENISFIREALDRVKHRTSNGTEYWSARDLMGVLAYSEWRNFSEVVEKAKEACSNSGNLIANHFVESNEMVSVGSGAKRKIDDWKMSVLACYLVAMNGDPSKPEVASAQAYFAVQTRLQEQQQALPETERRRMLRERVKNANKGLSSAAQSAGVRNEMFGVFHDEGYKGLYGGLGVAAIKKKKGIENKEDLLDRMGRTELAANEFRITQAEERIRNQNVTGESNAIRAHHTAGVEVRKAIKQIGGTLPELLQPEESLKRLASVKKRKSLSKSGEIDARD